MKSIKSLILPIILFASLTAHAMDNTQQKTVKNQIHKVILALYIVNQNQDNQASQNLANSFKSAVKNLGYTTENFDQLAINSSEILNQIKHNPNLENQVQQLTNNALIRGAFSILMDIILHNDVQAACDAILLELKNNQLNNQLLNTDS